MFQKHKFRVLNVLKYCNVPSCRFNSFILNIKWLTVPHLFTAITGGVLLFLLLFECDWKLHQCIVLRLNVMIFRHFIYFYIVRHHWFWSLWIRSQLVFNAIYMTLNLFCTLFYVLFSEKALIKTEILAIINMLPLYLGFHFSFVADILGILLQIHCHLHHSVKVISFILAVIHGSIMVKGLGKFIGSDPHLPGLIVSFLLNSDSHWLIMTRLGH